jgi:CHAT domain-containing protein
LGDIYRDKGDHEHALKSYGKTLSIRQKILGRQHHDIAENFTKLAGIYLDQGYYDQALNALQNSISANIFNFSYRDPYTNPPRLNILSESRLLASLERKALAFAKRYAAQSKDLQDLKAAVSTYELAIRLMDDMRSGYKAEASKLLLAKSAMDIYDRAIQAVLLRHRTLGEPQDLEKAFLFAEKSKGGILLEALSDAQAKQFANIPDSLLERERQLQLDLALYDRRIIDEQLKGKAADSTKIAQWRQKMFALQRAYETLLQQFEKDYRDYYDLKYQVRTASVKDVQEQILDERTAIVEYFTGKDSIFIFALTQNGFRVAPVAKDSSFERQVEWLRSGIVAKDFSRYASAARELHQALLKPVADQIEMENLIIIPDGAISGIPFETLLTATIPTASDPNAYSGLPYLATDHTISYAYSATLLLQTLNRKREKPPQDYLAFAPVFASGLPSGTRSADFFSESLALDSARVATRIRGYLSASRDEVKGILDIFERRYGFFEKLLGKKSRTYFAREANEENIKSPATAGYRYVHFATHGFVNEKNPKLSGLILEQDEHSNEDGILHLGEIYNLSLNADLVVLSACETGLGQIAKGEGIIGLTRGFLYAGAANLLVSLWQVNDETTADLMVNFYGSMLEGQTKAEALRQAKLNLIQSHPEYAKPYYWAPFILVGR